RPRLRFLQHGDNLAVGKPRCFHGNLLGSVYENLPLLATIISWGDYPRSLAPTTTAQTTPTTATSRPARSAAHHLGTTTPTETAVPGSRSSSNHRSAWTRDAARRANRGPCQ